MLCSTSSSCPSTSSERKSTLVRPCCAKRRANGVTGKTSRRTLSPGLPAANRRARLKDDISWLPANSEVSMPERPVSQSDAVLAFSPLRKKEMNGTDVAFVLTRALTLVQFGRFT
eukprot:scaffold17550_cov119-Isochrysis_galbana.AAC.5